MVFYFIVYFYQIYLKGTHLTISWTKLWTSFSLLNTLKAIRSFIFTKWIVKSCFIKISVSTLELLIEFSLLKSRTLHHSNLSKLVLAYWSVVSFLHFFNFQSLFYNYLRLQLEPLIDMSKLRDLIKKEGGIANKLILENIL